MLFQKSRFLYYLNTSLFERNSSTLQITFPNITYESTYLNKIFPVVHFPKAKVAELLAFGRVKQ